MKIAVSELSGQRGNVLMISLMLTSILGLTLGGYLYWNQTQHRLVAESQAWNTALTIAEAGVEEGMAQINIAFGTNFLSSVQTNGWGNAPGGGYGPRTNTLLGGYYSVVIGSDFPPSIYSTGYVQAPFGSRYITRAIKVTTTNSPAFASGGIATIQDITMNGNNVTVDSYDSADPLHSFLGQYNPLTRKAGGDIVSTAGSVSVGNAEIYGHLWTSPAGSVTVGLNGLVGDLPANWSTQSGIEPGWYTNDYNGSFKDVDPPFTSSLKNLSSAYDPLLKTYTLTGGDYYYAADFLLANNNLLLTAPSTTNRLYVTGNFIMTGQNGSVVGLGVNSTLQLFVGTTDRTMPVAAIFTTVTNLNAAAFQYYGLPSNTNVTWSGNASYEGTVYAPEAAFTLGGSGNTTTNDYQGACVVQSITMNGHFNFHFDENLRRTGPASGFVVTSWQEL